MIQSTSDTKERILDAAESLFAAHGIGATSLRAIIAKANVNLAAVHYHFGSKDALLEAVARRLFGPLNEQRIRLLDEAEKHSGKRGPSLEKILEAFIAPTVRLGADPDRGKTFMKLVGRFLGEPELFFEHIVAKQFGELRDRFVAAVARALPSLPPDEAMWRMIFSIGAMAQTLRVSESMPAISGGKLPAGTAEEHVRRLVAFLAAGMRAPVTKARKGAA